MTWTPLVMSAINKGAEKLCRFSLFTVWQWEIVWFFCQYPYQWPFWGDQTDELWPNFRVSKFRVNNTHFLLFFIFIFYFCLFVIFCCCYFWCLTKFTGALKRNCCFPPLMIIVTSVCQLSSSTWGVSSSSSSSASSSLFLSLPPPPPPLFFSFFKKNILLITLTCKNGLKQETGLLEQDKTDCDFFFLIFFFPPSSSSQFREQCINTLELHRAWGKVSVCVCVGGGELKLTRVSRRNPGMNIGIT